MIKYFFYFIQLTIFLACSEQNNQQSNTTSELPKKGKVLRFGTVSRHFLNIDEQYKPFDTYIANQLSEFGYASPKTILATSIEELKLLASEGKIDIYQGSLYSTIKVDLYSDLEPVLKQSINNNEFNHSLIFTKIGSEINSLDDLLGKVLVFEHDYSTSGYYYPKTQLIKMGYNFIEVKSPDQYVDKNSIGYCFSEHDQNSIAWVIEGYATVAATDKLSYESFSGIKLNQLKIIYQSQKFLRVIVSINKNLPKELRAKIITAFIKYPEIARQDPKLNKYYNVLNYDIIKGNEYLISKKEFEQFL